MSQMLLAAHEEVAENPESGDFMVGFLLGLLIGTRVPTGATAYLTAYLEASDEDQRATFSRLAEAIISAAGAR